MGGEKRLLIDRWGMIVNNLSEASDGSGKMIARGEFGRCDVPTENKRIYPRAVWEKQIEKILPEMREGKVLGELDHPADGKTSLKRVSHVMKNIWIEDDGRIMGEAEVCDNDYGKQLKSIFGAGGKVGVSSRGMGSTRMSEGGVEIVEDDYSYMTRDFVADPAVKSSYPKVTVEQVNKVTTENKEVKQVVESNPIKEHIMENKKMLTEEEVAKKLEEAKTLALEEQKKTFETQLTEKLVLLRESIEKEVRAQVMTDPAVVGAKTTVDQILNAVKPFIVKEDKDEVLEGKMKELAMVQKENAELKEKVAKMESTAKEIVESSKRMALKFFFENEVSKDEDRAELVEMVGDLKQYPSEKELAEAIKKNKSKIADKKKKAMEAKKKNEENETKHQAELKALREENAKTNGALEESLRKQKELSAKIYLENRTKGHPNARIIKKLCEGVVEKRKIDEVVKANSVASGKENLYNNVNERLARLEAVKRDAPKAVEQQLQEAKGDDKPQVTKEGDVDAEIAQVM